MPPKRLKPREGNAELPEIYSKFPFRVGDEVEMKSHESGYRGAWFRVQVGAIYDLNCLTYRITRSILEWFWIGLSLVVGQLGSRQFAHTTVCSQLLVARVTLTHSSSSVPLLVSLTTT
jgi:hypothetical protein